MPSYDYKCCDCNKEFTIRKSMNDPSTPSCPTCESVNVNRIWGGIQFKGSGKASGGCGGGCSSSCSGCGH